MFEKEKVYHRRTEIHDKHGGQWQGGISTPRNGPYIFLFTSDAGEQYGYNDGWLADGSFRYSGEGQRGDMQLMRGNLAIARHVENGKKLHLFRKVDKGKYVYEGEMEYVNHAVEERVSDIQGRTRTAIVFNLRRV